MWQVEGVCEESNGHRNPFCSHDREMELSKSCLLALFLSQTFGHLCKALTEKFLDTPSLGLIVAFVGFVIGNREMPIPL